MGIVVMVQENINLFSEKGFSVYKKTLSYPSFVNHSVQLDSSGLYVYYIIDISSILDLRKAFDC